MVSKNGPALLHATALALLNGLAGTSQSFPQAIWSLHLQTLCWYLSYPLIPLLCSGLLFIVCISSVYISCLCLLFILILERLKTADFERGMKLVTSRIDVRNDDRLMHLVFKEAVANGAVEIWAICREIWLLWGRQDKVYLRYDLLCLKCDVLCLRYGSLGF
jgi:hypothetical protein